MNEFSRMTPADELSFDRLVDGELSPAEYRDLLAGLDAAPEGWKRLALAFLEAQALGCELGKVREELATRSKKRTTMRPERSKFVPWEFLLAIAASLLL